MNTANSQFIARILLVAAMLGGGGIAFALPPTTQPSGSSDPSIPTPKLPVEFSILQSRNVFGSPKSHGAAQAPGGPEAGYVLKGVVQAPGGFVAFVEEVAAKQVRQLAAGDVLARGKIKSINIETIEYETDGVAHRIEVGQDLNGQTPPPPPTAPAAAPQPGADAGASPGPPGSPQPGGSPPGRPNNRRHGPPSPPANGPPQQ
jgi:hypothetical protein